MKQIRIFIMAAFLAAFCFPVQAATISPSYAISPNMGEVKFSSVTQGDTTAEFQVNAPGGVLSVLYKFYVEGTLGDAQLELQSGKTAGDLSDIDTDNMPDGLTFSSATTRQALVCLTVGEYGSINFNSAGDENQNLDFWLTPVAYNCQ